MINLEGIINDELQIYRGKDFFVKEGIVIHQPTLDEICNYGERQYWSMVYTLTSVGADMKFQLFDMGIDYTTISDFQLFYGLLSRSFSKEQTAILLGELDFSRLQIFQKKDSEDIVMYDRETNIEIDEYTYLMIADVLRSMHGLKRNDQLPANEATKQILIEDAREDYLRNKNREYHSQLKNMVSAMINCNGFKYNHNEVWNMKINAFIDSVRRISKMKNADLLLQSGYSGFGVNLKEISTKQLDWLGELD
ncbi:MAG: hypothetical protein K2N24_09150 [Lachnospiraceae bacterium]|nr:hypothetical protein [Lachnospiraceae bacterium]